MENSELALPEEGYSTLPSRNQRPTTSSMSIKPSFNFGRNGPRRLGRTKSLLLMDSNPSRAHVDRISQRFDDVLTVDNFDDRRTLKMGEIEKHQHQQPSPMTRRGSIRGLLHRAQNSIKLKTSRRSSSHTNHAAETSTFQKLRQVVNFKLSKHDPPPEMQDDYGLMIAPIPGNGSDPPLIPEYGGTAARANAAAFNHIYWQNRHPFLDGQGDRESGIGIATAASTASFQQSSTEPDSVMRVDFIKDLPCELAAQVLSHLDLRSLLAVELVSRQWNLHAKDPYVWREVFNQDKSGTYATSMPIAPGAGLGLPHMQPMKDWKKVYKVKRELERCWSKGITQSIYLHGHQDSIYCVQFDENKIVTGSRDKTVRVWDMNTFKCTLVIGCPAVIDELEHMENQNQDNPIHRADGFSDLHVTVSKPKKVSFPINHNASILCLQYDDEIMVTGSSDSTCIVHDIKDGYRPTMRLQNHDLAVLDLAFDKNYIVTCSKDTTICVWERQTGHLLKQLRGHTGPVNAIQLRGNSIVSCSGDTMVKLWNIDTGKIVREFQGHKKGLACSQFSEDSKLIASAGNDKTIRIWDAITGELMQEIDAHTNLVRSLHIDSVTGRLVSGSYDQDIKVWNMATGQLMLDFPKWHASWVLGAKCDYRRIISTGQDPKILIMDFGYDVDGIELLESTPRSALRAELDSLSRKMNEESRELARALRPLRIL